MGRIQCVSKTRINRVGLYHIALMQSTVNNADFKFDGVVGRERILHGHGVFHRAADGLRVVVVAQAMEARVERHRVVALRLHIPAQ